MKRTAIILLVSFIVTIVLFTAIKKFYFVTQSIMLNERQRYVLTTLGDSAVRHLDVPVASILVYNDSIIGTGYNTVIGRGNAGGHAEINALSSALRLLGKEKFGALDRNNLTLITTFEPCPMCRGAIIEYGIQRVVFLKPKSLLHWLTKHAQELRYEVTKKHGEPESLQDSLFMKHPQYQMNADD